MFENPKASCPVDTVYEYNARGKIPYVPVLRAPYYQWIGQRRDCTSNCAFHSAFSSHFVRVLILAQLGSFETYLD
jgi:hypothetical protein